MCSRRPIASSKLRVLPAACSLIQFPVLYQEALLDTRSIIAELEAERDRLDQAIAALQGQRRRVGRPRLSTAAGDGRRGPRRLSAAARKKISLAAKRRWAKAKAAGKHSL